MPETKLRFSDVAYAIDATPKTLRNWLQRGQVELASAQPESGWREFDIDDIPILALVRTIVAFGIEVREANRIAHGVLKHGSLISETPMLPVPLPSGETIDIRDVDGVVWPADDDWNYTTFCSSSGADAAITNAPASLVIRIGRVIARALQRAGERLAVSDPTNRNPTPEA